MKLAKPFYRLPVRFDVERLRAEVAAMPPDAWSRHPNDYAGNTAARLVTVGGSQNDSVGGAMAMTPALRSSIYLQQLLASFRTVISRCRLMRIAPGESVPQHSDVNYHWFYRTRIHVPIYTRPEVRFFCEDQDVHMAAGEAWIFDNWRQHKVLNPTDEPRVHLVADTTGTSYFWGLVAQAQTEGFERADPRCRLVPFEPSQRITLLLERYNVTPVMQPAEVEQLAFDLLGDLAPADESPEAVAAIGTFVAAVVDFTRDWRSLWSLFGDSAEGRPHYQQLLDHVHGKVRGAPVAVASVGVMAEHVLNTRILEHVLGPSSGRSRDAAEFNRTSSAPTAAAAPAAGPARAQASSGSVGFTADLLKAAGDSRAAAATPPAAQAAAAPRTAASISIERPVVILSAPRAGSTLLFETLAQVRDLYTIGGESHALIESIDRLRPGGGAVASNRLVAADATPELVDELRRRFAAGLHDRSGREPSPGAVRLLEKTPKNALRIPFLLEVFPDARFVFLHRDPRPNLSSIIEAWRSGGWVTYRQLPDWEGEWSLLLPPGYPAYRGRPLEEIAAFQWAEANRTILDDLAGLPADRWTTLRYEDFVADPGRETRRLLGFAGLEADDALDAYLAGGLPLSQYTQSAPDPDKWRRNEEAGAAGRRRRGATTRTLAAGLTSRYDPVRPGAAGCPCRPLAPQEKMMIFRQMWMGGVAAALISAAVPAMAEDAAKSDAAKAADEAVEQFSCRYERPTGSRKAVKVCREKTSVEEDADGSRRAMDKMKHYANPAASPPNG
jgi:hypothetical protein